MKNKHFKHTQWFIMPIMLAVFLACAYIVSAKEQPTPTVVDTAKNDTIDSVEAVAQDNASTKPINAPQDNCHIDDIPISDNDSPQAVEPAVVPTKTKPVPQNEKGKDTTRPVEKFNQKKECLNAFLGLTANIVILVLAGLLIIAILVIAFTYIFKSIFPNKANKEQVEKIINIMMCSIIILCITLICIYSNSSWAYLALVVLCILLLDKYIPGLLSGFSKVAAALHGKLDTSEPTQKELIEKRKSEVNENGVNDNISPISTPQGNKERNWNRPQDVQLINRELEEYIAVEQLAMNYLLQIYPNYQGPVKLQMNGKNKVVLDGLVQNDDKNIVVEIKYRKNIGQINYHLSHIFEAVNYITKKTGVPTILLLFIVAENDQIKQKMEELYKNKLIEGMNFEVQVYTKNELNLKNQTI